MGSLQLEFKRLSPETWNDLETLFGKNGACGGCWCMFWRLSRREFDGGKGDVNRRKLKTLAENGTEPGLIAFSNSEPVGWCSFGPRDDYPALERSRLFKKVDKKEVWSVSCLFVRKDFRNRGVSTALIRAAVDTCMEKGAKTVEAYPVEPKKGKAPDAFVWTGIASAYLEAGFREVARRSETRPILRFG